MAQTSGTRESKATDKNAVRPFKVSVPDARVAEMKRRIDATEWPEKETVADGSQGPQLATMQKIARYWSKDYDWKKCEAKLNAVPQFVTEIDGLDIHFAHVRSKHEDALPLIVTHGWPGSLVEQLKIIDPLTNPTAHGGSASDAFHLVIPELPGFGFSGKPTATGWDPAHIARAWVQLMKRLGYTKFAAQGGDWGTLVVNLMAEQGHPELAGIHTNLPQTLPPDVAKALATGSPAPDGLSAEEKRAYEQVKTLLGTGLGYAFMMGTRPQTLYALADSPIGLAAFMLTHDAASQQRISRLFDGQPYGAITRDDFLDNVTLCWLTGSAISSARIYWENRLPFLDARYVQVPAAVSVFPEEVYQAPRSWTAKAYPKLVHYNALAEGGHFAAWEQPSVFASELRTGLRSLRK